MSLSKKLFYFLFMVISVNATAATIYKWVDEDGQVHYGSKADKDNAVKVEIKNRYIDSGNSTKPLSAKERFDKQKRFLNALDAENKSISDEKRKKRALEERKIARCNASRDQLRRAEGASALYDLDKKGNRVLLNQQQYDQAMAQARARVEKWCN